MMMKKLSIALVCSIFSHIAIAQTLPFVGQKTFNFGPFSEEKHLITIQADGMMTVSLPEADTVLYQGQYMPLFPVYDALGELSGYYQFDGATKMNALNEYREFEMGCNREDEQSPCQAQLYDVQ